jgi:hypothetical protein
VAKKPKIARDHAPKPARDPAAAKPRPTALAPSPPTKLDRTSTFDLATLLEMAKFVAGMTTPPVAGCESEHRPQGIDLSVDESSSCPVTLTIRNATDIAAAANANATDAVTHAALPTTAGKSAT